MWLIDRLAETKILEAIENGELDNLPGEGRPIKLEDDSMVPEELRAGYRILRNAGFLPPELKIRSEITQVEALLQLVQEPEQKQMLSKRLNYLLAQLNQSRNEQQNIRSESEYFERLSQRFSKVKD
ncbi:DnaJ family domain-containing protein [Kaarinaea lacus]